MDNFLEQTLSFWTKLTEPQKEKIKVNMIYKSIPKGTAMSYGGKNCTGIQLFKTGQMRVYLMSPEGGQITLYRLIEKDICVMSAVCMLNNIDFDIFTTFEKDSEVYTIPKQIFSQISEENPEVAKFMLDSISSRFSNVMNLMNQIVFSGMGSRLSEKLIEHSSLTGSNVIYITHDEIANDLGTAREVVSRLLKQFQLDELVKLSRGKIEILDMARLIKL